MGVSCCVSAYKRESCSVLALLLHHRRNNNNSYIRCYIRERYRYEDLCIHRQRSHSRREEVAGRNDGHHKAQGCRQGLAEENQLYAVQVGWRFIIWYNKNNSN